MESKRQQWGRKLPLCNCLLGCCVALARPIESKAEEMEDDEDNDGFGCVSTIR